MDLRSYALRAELEWERLGGRAGAVEFTVTKALIDRHFPDAGRVLDIGGGPGRYAEWLTQRGFHVTLADAVPELLDIARERVPEIEEIVTADARDLSRWPDNSFDAVLCMGPLYHLTSATDRRRAISEVVRVLRPGGLAAFALITKYSHLRRLISRPVDHAEFADPEFLRRIMEDGIYQRAARDTFNGYAVAPGDAAKEFDGCGLQTVTLAAIQGFLCEGCVGDNLEQLRAALPDAYEQIIGVLLDSATDPTFLGGATHLLYIGRLPQSV